MAHADQNVREDSIAVGEIAKGVEVTDEQLAAIRAMEHVDRRNTERLKEIVDEVGWPGRSRVGSWVSYAAWLLVQHANDREFQSRALRLMKAMKRSEVDQANVALLTDRLLVQERKEQIYGSQFTCRNGRRVLSTPLHDPDGVDELRRGVGLSPYAENARRIEKLYGPCPKGKR